MISERKIPVCCPVLGEEEQKYIQDCIDTAWISQGKYVKQFEEEFSKYCECEYGVACSNGTTALHLVIKALGIDEGDEVLVATSTNMASAFSVYYEGALPIPVDIEKDTWQLDPSKLEEKITEKTKAIMVVHLFGLPVDMDPVMEIAKKHNLKVIEDCAQAHGARYKGKKVGSIGDVGCFSFYANKIITAGEGGMVVTNNSEIADKARNYGNFCYGKENKFMHNDIGYNYRIPHMSAALALGQLQRIDSILEKKEHIYQQYKKGLENISAIHIPERKEYSDSVMWMFNVELDESASISRNEFMKKLKGRGIETREAFVPINKQKVFLEKGFVKEDDCPVANYIMDQGLYLPSGLNLTNEDIHYVVQSIQEILQN